MADNRKKRIAEAQEILTTFGLPTEQRNERAALTLLACFTHCHPSEGMARPLFHQRTFDWLDETLGTSNQS